MIKDHLNKNNTVGPNSREIEKLIMDYPQFFDKHGNFIMEKLEDVIAKNEINITKEGYSLNFLGKSYAKFLTSTESKTVITPDIIHNGKDQNKNSENLYIVGDNIDAIKHLLKSYSGKIQCIYIDPPYNTGNNDFVYPDNFEFKRDELAKMVDIDEDEADRILNMAGKSTHSAWLTFMYPRLLLAMDLLSDEGVMFISIDDNEHANLKVLCDEIYGENRFLGTITWEKRTKAQNTEDAKNMLQSKTEYILVYKKKTEKMRFNLIVKSRKEYDQEDSKGKFRYKKVEEMSAIGMRGRKTMIYPIKGIYPGEEKQWKIGVDTVNYYLENDDIELIDNYPYIKMRPEYEDELSYEPFWSHFYDKDTYGTAESGKTELTKVLGHNKHGFETVKPSKLISKLIYHVLGDSKNENDYPPIVLDFFSGSGTTADAVMQLNSNEEYNGNYRYIMVQLPEEINENNVAYDAGYRTIDEIGRDRIKKAAEKIKEETNADIDYGFKLFKLNTPEQKTLDKLVDFNPVEELALDDMINVFSFGNVSGKETILTTWLNEDGYGLCSKVDKIKLKTYEADLHDGSLYIVEEGITSEDIMELIKKIENNELMISRVVVYPYSLPFNQSHELKKNIANLRQNKNITVIERY